MRITATRIEKHKLEKRKGFPPEGRDGYKMGIQLTFEDGSFNYTPFIPIHIGRYPHDTHMLRAMMMARQFREIADMIECAVAEAIGHVSMPSEGDAL